MRDAGADFDARAEAVMRKLGFDVGLLSPRLCFCRASGVGVLRHGDDFVAPGGREAGAAFSQELGEELIVKNRGTLGPRPDLGDVGENAILNWIARWTRATSTTPELIKMEADARRVPERRASQ